MSMNKPEQPVSVWNRAAAALRRFWDRLTAPGPGVVDFGDRRLAQILAVLALLFAVLNGLGVLTSAAINQVFGTSANLTLLALMAVAIVSYVLSRGRYFRIGCWLLVWSLALSGFLLLPTSDSPASAIYSTVVLAYAMGTVLLPVWGLTALVAVTTVALFAMPAVLPAQFGAAEAGAVGGNIMTVGIMLAILSAFRNSVERSRIREAQAANEQMRILSANLEHQVTSRTQELTLAGQVGRSLGQERDLDHLLTFSVEQIQSAFNLYYTQIYLLDPSGRALVLRAGSGEVGAELLRRAHRLEVGLGSVNGRAALERRPVLVSDTAASRTFRPNPLLPGTRSEAAVPLIVGTRLVGVLDMQSEAPGTFSEENLPAFETLAGQLAVAVDNAALLSRLTQAQKDVEAAASAQAQRNWSDYLDAIERGEVLGFDLQLEDGALQVQPWSADGGNGSHSRESLLAVPLEVSGMEVGAISFERSEGEWSHDERELVQAIAGRVALQLDGLRLLEQSESYRNQAEAATRRLQRQGWDEFLAQRAAGGLAYAYDRVSVSPAAAEPEIGAPEPLTWPLATGGQALGEISLEGLDGLDAAAAGMIETVASRLAEHIDSLRLAEQTRLALASTEALYTGSARVVSAASYDQILNAVVNATALSRFERGVLMVFNREWRAELGEAGIPESGRIAAVWEPEGEGREVAGRVYPLQAIGSRGFLQPAAPTIITDLAASDAPQSLKQALSPLGNSLVLFPLVASEQWIGLLTVASDSPVELNEAEQRQVLSLVSQTSAVVQGLRLLEQAQARARREQTLRQVAERVRSGVDVERVLQTAAREVGQALDRNVIVRLTQPGGESPPPPADRQPEAVSIPPAGLPGQEERR